MRDGNNVGRDDFEERCLELNALIVALEDWLSEQRPRVECHYYPDEESRSIAGNCYSVSFERYRGQQWRFTLSEAEENTRVPLTSAPLDVRIAAVPHLGEVVKKAAIARDAGSDDLDHAITSIRDLLESLA